jgi:rod shape-determining protein MreB
MSTTWLPGRRQAGFAIDLGSTRTRVWAVGRGLILDVPTVTFPGAGTAYPVRRGAIIDVPGTARMLDRLLRHRLPRVGRPLVVLTTPVLDGVAYRQAARAAVEVLRPRVVLTVPTARAVALSAREDLSRPLLVVDIGAHLTEAVLLVDGAVTDAHRTATGTGDVHRDSGPTYVADAVVAMVAALLEQDRTADALDALRHGVLLAGGGALRPEVVYRLARRLDAPVKVVPAPHTAAVRGAAELLGAARLHPSFTGHVRASAHEYGYE